ncbi:hypothetical protein [Paenibacillus lemnae]|uniref:Uncharacterized protein n=1 Tax=Paenibacillus lemnae TaxID=1330551 RepID=A0A848M878_PAELE|nr:hypothetical protein [Paenibacillus lemnae]NMO97237.1 hypothetical protein [Paenibacillus lemnae]
MKRTWMAAGIAVLAAAISWTWNLWHYHQNQLGEPLFLDHHIDLQRQGFFDLYYLEDLNTEHKVMQVNFPDNPELKVQHRMPSCNAYTYQQLCSLGIVSHTEIEVQDTASNQAKADAKPLVVQVMFTDGASKIIETGTIRQLPGNENNDMPVNHTSSGSSSNGTGFSSLHADRPVQWVDAALQNTSLIESGKLDVYAEIYNNHVRPELYSYGHHGGVDPLDPKEEGQRLEELQFPLSLNKGDAIQIRYRINRNKFEPDEVYYTFLRMTFQDVKGEGTWEDDVVHVNRYPDLTNTDVRELVKERRSANEKGL